MSDPRPDLSAGRTRLAARRLAMGMTQRQLADASGVPLGTLRRWEQTGKPPRQLAHVVNCAIVLGCEDRLALVEEHWLTWTPLAGASQPPSALPHPAPLPLVAPPRSHRDRETYVRDDDREEFEQFLRGGD